jgi:hypothetical protein
MKTRFKHIALLRLILITILCASFVNPMMGCSGGSGNFLSGTNSGIDSDSTDPLSDAESSLYESGPAGLPVTIAKLEYYIDTDKVTLSILTEGYYTIALEEGVTEDDYVYIYNTENEEVVIIATSDLPTEITMAADEGDLLALAAAESDTPSTVGIPSYVSFQDGQKIRQLTNTNALNTEVLPLATSDGLYLSTISDTVTNTNLMKIDRVTQEIDVVIDDLAGSITQIMTSSDTAEDLKVLLEDGDYYETALTDTVWSEPTLFYGMGLDYPTNPGVNPPLRSFNASDGGLMICKTPWFDNTDTPDDNETSLIYVDAAGNATELTSDTRFYHVVDCHQYQNTDTILALIHPYNGGGTFDPVKIYEMDMTDGVDAFTNATVKLTMAGGVGNIAKAYGFHMDQAGKWYVINTELGNALTATYITVYDIDADTSTEIENETVSGHDYSPYVRINSEGYVFTCNHESYEGNTDDNYIVVHRFGVDPVNEWWRITALRVNPCQYQFDINSRDDLVFMTSFEEVSSPPSNTASQIRSIKSRSIDFTTLEVE